MNRIMKNKGFSLIEIVVSIGLLTVVMAGIFGLILTGTNVSNNINKSARNENAVVTIMQTIRSEISNAEVVKIASKSEIASPEVGYSYLYCDSEGGLSVYRNGAVTKYNTIHDLKDSKIFVTFKGCQSDALGSTALRVNVALYPYNSGVSNAVSIDDLTYTQTRVDGLTAIGSGFNTSEEISFHNLNRRNLRIEDSLDPTVDGASIAGRVLKYKMPNPADYIDNVTPNPSEVSTTTPESSTEATTSSPTPEGTTVALTGDKYTGYKTLFISGNQAKGQIYIDNQTYNMLNPGEWSATFTLDMPVSSITCAGNKCTFTLSDDKKTVIATGMCSIPSGSFQQFDVDIVFAYDSVSMNVNETNVNSVGGGMQYQVRVSMDKPQNAPAESGTWSGDYTIPETAQGYVSNISWTNDKIKYTFDETTNTYTFTYSGDVTQTFDSVFTIVYTYGVKPPVVKVHYNSVGESAYGLNAYESLGSIVVKENYSEISYSPNSNIEFFITSGNTYTIFLRSSWWNEYVSGFPPKTTYTYDQLSGNDIWIKGSYMELSPTQPSWW